MSSTRNGKGWYFGMKTHVRVNADSGIVHSLERTTAKTHDSQVRDELLHGDETSVWVDKGDGHASREAVFTKKARAFRGVMRKAQRAASSILSTQRSTGSSPRCGPRCGPRLRIPSA